MKNEAVERGQITGAGSGPLEGEALEKEREGRRQRAQLLAGERFRRWKEGTWPDPEIAFWMRETDIEGA